MRCPDHVAEWAEFVHFCLIALGETFQWFNSDSIKRFGPFKPFPDGVIFHCICSYFFEQPKWYIHFPCPYKWSSNGKVGRTRISVTLDGIDDFDTKVNNITSNNWRLLSLLEYLLIQNFGSMPKVSVSLTAVHCECWATLLTAGNISRRHISGEMDCLSSLLFSSIHLVQTSVPVTSPSRWVTQDFSKVWAWSTY